MNPSENPFSLTRAAPSTSGRAKNQIIISISYSALRRWTTLSATLAAFAFVCMTTPLALSQAGGTMTVATGITNPVICVSPSSLDFGRVAIGRTNDLYLRVQNLGSGTLTGSATTSPPFSIIAGRTYSLGSGQSQLIGVRYLPRVEGTNSQSVALSGGGNATVAVSGVAKTIRLPPPTGLRIIPNP
jgi:hypothetical protein